MRKKLLILGAGWSHIPGIRIAKKMGIFTVVMDKNPNAPGLKISDYGYILDGSNKENVLRIASKEGVDGILCTGDYSVIPASYASTKLGLSCIPYNIATLVSNKGKLFEKFRKCGVSLPKGKLVSNLKEAKSYAQELGFPIILKPASSFGGSRGVIRVENSAHLSERYYYCKKNNLDPKIIMEQFLPGIEHTIESITINGKTHTLAISDKIRTTGAYCVGLSLDYPSIQRKSIISKLKKQAGLAISASGIKNGVTHIEAISFKNEVYIIDFGARGGAGGYITSVVVPKLIGINMMEKMIQISLGEKISSLKPRFSQFVTYRFLSAKPGIVQEIKGIKKRKKIPGLIDLKVLVKKGDKIQILRNQLLRSGYFVVEGKNFKQIQERIKRIENTIKIVTKHVGEKRSS